MSKAGIAHVEKQLAKMKKDGNPGAKYLQKILDNPTSKTNVLRNGIAAHCFDCSWDSADPAESHPKNCTQKSCAHYSERPMSGAEKAEKKASKEVAPEVKAKKQENAAKARAGRKSFKECLEAVESAEIIEEGADKVINSKKGKVLMSYDTVVALIKPDGTAFKTSDKFSTTTSKHINKFLAGKDAETKPQKWFDNLL